MMAVSILMFAMLVQQMDPATSPPRLLNTADGLIQRADYPPLAMIDDVQGATGFVVDVDASGRPQRCAVAQSSGSALLDQTTCRLLLRRARFAPAVRGGEAVPGQYRSRVQWRLAPRYVMVDPRYDGPARRSAQAIDALAELTPDDVGAPPATSFVLLDVSRAGVVTACRPDGGDAEPSRRDAACARFVGKELFIPGFDGEGNAESDRVRVKIRW